MTFLIETGAAVALMPKIGIAEIAVSVIDQQGKYTVVHSRTRSKVHFTRCDMLFTANYSTPVPVKG